jgi:hypothetical protein
VIVRMSDIMYLFIALEEVVDDSDATTRDEIAFLGLVVGLTSFNN